MYSDAIPNKNREVMKVGIRGWSLDKNRDWFLGVVHRLVSCIHLSNDESLRLCREESPHGCDTLFVMVYAHPITERAERWMVFCDWLMDGNWGDEHAVYGEYALTIIQNNPGFVTKTTV